MSGWGTTDHGGQVAVDVNWGGSASVSGGNEGFAEATGFDQPTGFDQGEYVIHPLDCRMSARLT